MYKTATLITLLAGFGTAFASAAQLQWPADAQDESDPRVVAFYNGQCGQWAVENGLKGEAAANFTSNCVKNAPDVWPVGMEKSSGGE